MATITADEMAIGAGASPRAFQEALQVAGIKWHSPGTHWIAECGSKHEADMRAVLDALLAKQAEERFDCAPHPK